MRLYLWIISRVQVWNCPFFGTSVNVCISTHLNVYLFMFGCIQVLLCVYLQIISCLCVSVRLQHLSNCWCIRESQLFDLGAVPGLSTRCAGWSPIMLGWSQTQPHYWLPGRPSHQPRCYTPLTTSLARLNPPSPLCYTLLCQQQEASAGTAGTQPGGLQGRCL